MADATPTLRRVLKLGLRLDADARDPSIFVQHRKRGVRLMLMTRVLNGQHGGFVHAAHGETVEEAALALLDAVERKARGLVDSLTQLLDGEDD